MSILLQQINLLCFKNAVEVLAYVFLFLLSP